MLNKETERRIDSLVDELLGKESTEVGFCNDCPHHEFLPDPDPHDWFNDDDKKLVCHKIKGVIEGALRPIECREYKRPSYCPFHAHKLSEEEAVKAAERLAYAQERWTKEVVG